MSKSGKTLVLLDSHAIIHRAYHALPDFSSSRGEPTGALYGLSNMLMKIVTDLKPDYMVACYDLPGKTFRHESYEAYKAGRAKADDALVAQIKESRKIFEAFDVPIYDAPGFEADDVLGTIVEKLKNRPDIKIIIASGDMDTMQLVEGDKVQIFTLRKGVTDTVLYDENAVREKFGFLPQYIADYKGLRGDPSDNIKGIPGIGEKTATILISSLGSVEDIYRILHSKGGDEKIQNLGLTERIVKLLKENEEEAIFSKTLAKIRTDAPVDFSLPIKTFWQSVDFDKVKKVFLEYEFRSLVKKLPNFFNGSGAPNTPQSLPLGHKEDLKIPERKLKEISIALWLLDSEITNPALEDILDFANTEDFDEASKIILEKLDKDPELKKVYSEIELPIIDAVARMEKHGILIDQKYFSLLSEKYKNELERISKEIYSLAGEEFNINSPKQLSSILFEKLGIKSSKKKKESGSFSTNIEVLEELSSSYKIAGEIIKYRELQKLVSTYIDVLPGMVGMDGRLHAKFLQNGTTTGRFSSQDPNLQNLPIKSDLGRAIRNGFVAPLGYQLLALDYSQIELRVAAMLSLDKKLTQIFKDGKDVHSGVASFVFGVPMEKVDSEMRRRAKVINFGIIYGMGVSALQKNLGSTREEAQKFYDNYFNQFSGVRDYLDSVKEFALKNKYTKTLFGRKRNFPNINSKIPFVQGMAIRTAINAPIQGTATADIIKLAIRFAEEDLRSAGILDKTHLVLQIHDELVYEVRDDVLGEATEIIENAMKGVLERSYLKYKTPIPLLVNSASAKNLGEVK